MAFFRAEICRAGFFRRGDCEEWLRRGLLSIVLYAADEMLLMGSNFENCPGAFELACNILNWILLNEFQTF